MFDSIQELLLNLLFILVSILLFQLFMDSKYRTRIELKRASTAFSGMAIILCMSFPIHLENGFLYDLRIIPLVIGSLYGAKQARVLLMLLTLAYRYYFGGSGFLTATLIIIVICLITDIISNKFLRARIRTKIMYSSGLTFLSAVYVLFSSHFVFGNEISLQLWVVFLVVQTASAAFCTYLVETIQNNYLIRDKLLRYEKLEVVSHLAASISHEVRNPMTSIRGFLQMLQQPDLSEKKKQQYLSIAIDELDRAGSIINDYLIFAKPHPEELNVLKVEEEVNHVVDILNPYSVMNNVEIITNINNASFTGNRGQFRQSLINFIKNGIEAMPEGGQLCVETEHCDTEVIIRIMDDGMGMTKEQVRRLGEPFFTTKEGSKGTGLGMMVAYRVIESMKGSVQVESEPELGTKFTIRLPVLK